MLLPADVEFTVREYLKPLLDVPILSKVGDPPNQLVTYSLGGAEATIVSGRPRLVFDCYGEREAKAWALAQKAWGLVKDLDCRFIAGVQFYEIDAALPVNLPHPDKPDLYRYQFNATIHARHVRAS